MQRKQEATDVKDHVHFLSRVKRFLRRHPPPLPAALPAARAAFPGADYCFLIVTLLIWCTLLGQATGVLPPTTVVRHQMWLVYPFTQAYLHLAQAGLGPLIGALESPPADDFVGLQMFALFAGLQMQALCFLIFCALGPKRDFCGVLHLPACIYSCAFTYYTYRSYGTPLLLCDWVGLPLYPLHLCMWMSSTSVQCLLWCQIYTEQCWNKQSFKLPATPLLLAQLMLWSGLLGHVDFGPAGVAPNVALNLLCFAFFFGFLHSATRPLRLAAEHYRRLTTTDVPATVLASSNDAGSLRRTLTSMHRLESHFRLANRYVWVTWQFFPLVWALGMAGIVDGRTRENLFSFCDLLAKFLPVSMYLSLLDVRY